MLQVDHRGAEGEMEQAYKDMVNRVAHPDIRYSQNTLIVTCSYELDNKQLKGLFLKNK